MQIAFWDIGEDGNKMQNDTIRIVHTSAQPGQLFDVTSIGYWLLYVLPRCICFWRCAAQPNLFCLCENQMSRINEAYFPVWRTVTQPVQLPFFFQKRYIWPISKFARRYTLCMCTSASGLYLIWRSQRYRKRTNGSCAFSVVPWPNDYNCFCYSPSCSLHYID